MQTNTAEKIEPRGLKTVLRSANKPQPVAKSTTPRLDNADQSTKELATEIAAAKKALDTAEALFKLKSAELIQRISDQRKQMCRKEYISSLRVPTTDGLSVLVTWTGNYKKIAPDREQAIVGVVGDKYQDYFKSKFVIKAEDKSDDELFKLFEMLSPDGGATPEGLEEGQRRFAEFFVVDEVIRPTERFVHDHVLMDEEKRNELEAAGVCQYTPSIKTR